MQVGRCRQHCPDHAKCPSHKYLVNPTRSTNHNPGKAHVERLEARGIAPPPTKPWDEWQQIAQKRQDLEKHQNLEKKE